MVGFTDEQLRQLGAPLARQNVRERTQAGRKFSYIEGWRAIAEANRIFGFDSWDRETVDVKCVAETETKMGPRTDRNGDPIAQKDGYRVAYVCKARLTVRAGDRAIVREGSGYGSGIDADLGQAHESALKEAETDSMKRALMTFGNPFGLALYDKDQENVVSETRHDDGNATISAPVSHAKPTPRPARTANAAQDKEWEYANAAWARLRRAMEIAKLPKVVDEIVSVNAGDLEKIKAASADAYDDLMSLAAARKTEMLAAA